MQYRYAYVRYHGSNKEYTYAIDVDQFKARAGDSVQLDGKNWAKLERIGDLAFPWGDMKKVTAVKGQSRRSDENEELMAKAKLHALQKMIAIAKDQLADVNKILAKPIDPEAARLLCAAAEVIGKAGQKDEANDNLSN